MMKNVIYKNLFLRTLKSVSITVLFVINITKNKYLTKSINPVDNTLFNEGIL